MNVMRWALSDLGVDSDPVWDLTIHYLLKRFTCRKYLI